MTINPFVLHIHRTFTCTRINLQNIMGKFIKIVKITAETWRMGCTRRKAKKKRLKERLRDVLKAGFEYDIKPIDHGTLSMILLYLAYKL